MSRVRFVAVPLVIATLAAAPAAAAAARPCWRHPVEAPVLDPFRVPACTWCPGNRGIEYDTVPGEAVRSVATGVVTFSGIVADRRFVVVDVGAGYRVTFGDLRATGLRRGDPVLAGTTIGAAGDTLHFGVREGQTYVDPAQLLGRLVARPRLVPTDGSPRRAAPPPTLNCGR